MQYGRSASDYYDEEYESEDPSMTNGTKAEEDYLDFLE